MIGAGDADGAARCAPTIIAAVAGNGVIGRDNALPWRLPEDMRRFRELTSAEAVIMGRRTWESQPSRFRPLPQRLNIVLSRQGDYVAPGATCVASLQEAIAAAMAAQRIPFIIGGAALYAAAMPLAQRMELTEIDADFAGDALFPVFNRSCWREVKRLGGVAADGLAYAFVTYERV